MESTPASVAQRIPCAPWACAATFAAQAMRVGDNGLHLFQGVLRGLRIVALGEHAAGGADLDEVGAVLDVLAHLVLHGGDAVGHAVAHGVIADGQQILIAVAAGDADERAADQHVRVRAPGPR